MQFLFGKALKTTDACRARVRAYQKTTAGKVTKKRSNKKFNDSKKGQECMRNAQLTCRYGITLAEYDALLEKQGGGCAICGKKSADKRNRRLHVDHDHKTGKVRGLLCHQCNTGLGKFYDDINLLNKASSYLQ